MKSHTAPRNQTADQQLTVLEEAMALTVGPRAETYGPARANAEAWAQVFSAITGLDVKPEHLPVAMIALKLARSANAGWHRDTWVDIAGYARVAELINQPTGEE